MQHFYSVLWVQILNLLPKEHRGTLSSKSAKNSLYSFIGTVWMNSAILKGVLAPGKKKSSWRTVSFSPASCYLSSPFLGAPDPHAGPRSFLPWLDKPLNVTVGILKQKIRMKSSHCYWCQRQGAARTLQSLASHASPSSQIGTGQPEAAPGLPSGTSRDVDRMRTGQDNRLPRSHCPSLSKEETPLCCAIPELALSPEISTLTICYRESAACYWDTK